MLQASEVREENLGESHRGDIGSEIEKRSWGLSWIESAPTEALEHGGSLRCLCHGRDAIRSAFPEKTLKRVT